MTENFDDLIRKAKEMEAMAEACPLHEWEVYVSKLHPFDTRTFDNDVAETWTYDGQPIGSLVCKNCGLRRSGKEIDPHRDLKENYLEIMHGGR